MTSINPGDILYTFMGERLIRLTVLDIIDDSRLQGEDEENIYVFYSDSCYESESEAYLGMERMLEKSTIRHPSRIMESQVMPEE